MLEDAIVFALEHTCDVYGPAYVKNQFVDARPEDQDVVNCAQIYMTSYKQPSGTYVLMLDDGNGGDFQSRCGSARQVAQHAMTAWDRTCDNVYFEMYKKPEICALFLQTFPTLTERVQR